MKRLFIIIPLVLFIGLFMVMGEMLTRDRNPSEIKSVLIGKPAPAFMMPSLNGRDVISQDILKQKQPTIVNFFASWCVPCLAEHTWLTTLQEKNIPIIGIAYKDKPEDSQTFLNNLGNPFINVASDLDGRVAIDWGVYGVPETFIIDSNGIIRYKHFGPITENRFKDLLKAYEEAKQ